MIKTKIKQLNKQKNKCFSIIIQQPLVDGIGMEHATHNWFPCLVIKEPMWWTKKIPLLHFYAPLQYINLNFLKVFIVGSVNKSLMHVWDLLCRLYNLKQTAGNRLKRNEEARNCGFSSIFFFFFGKAFWKKNIKKILKKREQFLNVAIYF